MNSESSVRHTHRRKMMMNDSKWTRASVLPTEDEFGSLRVSWLTSGYIPANLLRVWFLRFRRSVPHSLLWGRGRCIQNRWGLPRAHPFGAASTRPQSCARWSYSAGWLVGDRARTNPLRISMTHARSTGSNPRRGGEAAEVPCRSGSCSRRPRAIGHRVGALLFRCRADSGRRRRPQGPPTPIAGPFW